MSGKYDISGYVEVADRLSEAFERWPEGSMQGEVVYVENPPGWLASAAFYRTPDDARPGIGHAFEPTPGKTPYTRDSECMNAETSAWGRALVAVGLKTKHIASANEVRARREDNGQDRQEAGRRVASPPPADDIPFGEPKQTTFQPPPTVLSDKQLKMLNVLVQRCVDEGVVMANGQPFTVEALRSMMGRAYGVTSKKELGKAQASDLITRLKSLLGEAES